MRIRWILLSIVFLVAASSEANATLLTFSDRTTFLTATGATSATGPLPNLGFVPGSQTVGSVTFSITPPSSALFIGGLGTGIPGGDWTTLLPGNDIAISDVENLNAALSSPVFSLGFDFAEPNVAAECFAPCFDSTFGVTLKNGAITVGSFTFNAPDEVAAFVGVWTSDPFSRVEIRDLTATIDDEYFGQFYTGAAPVPALEPATLLLLGSGLAGLGLWGLRKMNRRSME